MNLTGQTLGDYQLQAVIGRGPRAAVYRARHAPDNRIVAVKVYDESVDPDHVRQAFESAQALTHAHALPVDRFGVHRGLAWVAMRHMPVGSVKARWRGVAPLNEIARVLQQIASALDHAHAHGLLHLNLKPANILLDHPGNAFAADFGIQALPDSPYVAPETGRNTRADARADVYSLGAVLYEMLTGRAPVARRPRDDKANQRMAELPSPRSIRGDIPPACEAVVMRALSIDPESRYATPGALAQAFAQAVEAASSEQSQATPPRRIPAIGWIAAGIVGLLLVGAIVLSGGSNAPAVTAPSSPAPEVTEPPVPTEESSPAPTRTSIPDTPTLPPTVATRTSQPALARTATPSPTAAQTATARPSLTSTPAFRVVSLVLKPPPSRVDVSDRLDLLFDMVVQPPDGGPYGQLFAYLPGIDPLVTTRIGAQVSSGTQVLVVTLAVDCTRFAQPATTDHIFLEIRETDRGPALYSTAIEYTKTWCG